MPLWGARAAIQNTAASAAASDAAEAASEISAAIQAALPGWTVMNITTVASYEIGEWVVAKRGPAAPEEYARIVQGASVQVEFADGTRRGLAAVVRRA